MSTSTAAGLDDRLARQQKLWAKTEAGGRGDPLVTHPAYLHLIDCGVAFRALLSGLPDRVSARIRALYPALDREQSADALTVLAALHDLGKISPGFQARRDQSRKTLSDLGLNVPLGALQQHDVATLKALRVMFRSLGVGPDRGWPLAGAVAAHHGSFLTVPRPSVIGNAAWDGVRAEAVDIVRAVLAPRLGLEALASSPDTVPAADALVLYAGAVSVADWIASNEQWFPFQSDVLQLSEYLGARSLAADAVVKTLHLAAPSLRSDPGSFAALFDLERGAEPNDVQRAAMRFAEQADTPSLYVIETPMGSGKTEAALSVYRAEIDRGARGLYYGLPTQASGNLMFNRVTAFLKRLLAGPVEAHLLHSEAFLHDEYRAIRAANNGVHDAEGGLVATEWFTGAKRGLLSSHGVGTIDQAMLASLKRTHFFVRLFGLAGKVVVLDEVHAYDVYVSEILRYLLGWLAAVDATVVLLSATLPARRRQQLIDAYAPNAGVKAEPYPCVTVVSERMPQSVRISSPQTEVTVEIVAVAPDQSVDWMIAKVLELAAGGGCVACLCNTVGHAQDVYRGIVARDPAYDVLLFHSKFTRVDRRDREKTVGRRFGKPGERPARAIVIATQVIEQSLDLDFDCMVTEIAPVDLLLQRIGRVHRHKRARPSAMSTPRLVVAVPPEITARCYEPSSFVYEPIVLARTHLALQEHGPRVTLPNDVSTLVERVYGDSPVATPTGLSSLLEKWEEEAFGGHQAELWVARDSVIPTRSAVDEDPSILAMGALGSDAEAPVLTRLARPSIGVAVLDREIAGIPDSETIRRVWELVVRIDWSGWYEHFRDLPLPASWKRTALLRDLRPAVFVDGIYRNGDRELHYASDLGLFQTRTEGANGTSI